MTLVLPERLCACKRFPSHEPDGAQVTTKIAVDSRRSSGPTVSDSSQARQCVQTKQT